jgi:hypothetical protein
MTINLNTCVRGQKCINKDGKYLTYLRKINNNPRYHHLLLNESSSVESYTNDGIYGLGYPDTKYNIVCILPMESTTPASHPSIAWWESCPWITDRKPTKEDADKFGRVLVTAEPDKILTASFQHVSIGEAWIHHGCWQPPALTNREQALQLLDDHQAGWMPTPGEWHIIRKGLEAS